MQIVLELRFMVDSLTKTTSVAQYIQMLTKILFYDCSNTIIDTKLTVVSLSNSLELQYISEHIDKNKTQGKNAVVMLFV